MVRGEIWWAFLVPNLRLGMPATTLCVVQFKTLVFERYLIFPRSQPPVGNACHDALRRTILGLRPRDVGASRMRSHAGAWEREIYFYFNYLRTYV
jgi:hypothetical protein